MIEAKFYTPPNFVLDDKIGKIIEEVNTILGGNLDTYTLGPHAPVSNVVTKVIGRVRVNPVTQKRVIGSDVSIWYDPDADRVHKRGIKIGVYGVDEQVKIYNAVINVLGLDDKKSEKTIT